jgi:hypothetical protein
MTFPLVHALYTRDMMHAVSESAPSAPEAKEMGGIEAFVAYAGGLPVVYSMSLGSPSDNHHATLELFSLPREPMWMEWLPLPPKDTATIADHIEVEIMGPSLATMPHGVPWEGRLTFWHNYPEGSGAVVVHDGSGGMSVEPPVTWRLDAYSVTESKADRIVSIRVFPTDALHAAVPWIQEYRTTGMLPMAYSCKDWCSIL